jgi:alpha-amylase/alpha-mannosidase (GH57 family)
MEEFKMKLKMVKNYLLQITEEELETLEFATEISETELELPEPPSDPEIKQIKYALEFTEEDFDKIKYALERCKKALEQMPAKFREPELTKTKKLLKEFEELNDDEEEEEKATQENIDLCPNCSIAYCQGRYTTGQCE